MPNQQIYDTVFRDYFNDKRRLLSLCNTMLGTACTDPDQVRINTLDWTFFSNLRNDLSCLFLQFFMLLMEHQHTWSRNLPIRLLLYAAEQVKNYIAGHKKELYKETLFPLPVPTCICFYDGRREAPERTTMRLSDAFGGDSHTLELKVTVYNLNEGMNEDLKASCPYLNQYSRFSNYLNAQLQAGKTHDEAVKATLEYCRKHGIMEDYFAQKGQEVFDMLNFAWNEDDARDAWLEEGTERGIQLEQKNQAHQREQEESKRVLQMLRDEFAPDVIARYSPFSLEHIQDLGRSHGLL